MKIFNRYYSSADILLVLGDIVMAILVTGAVRGLMYVTDFTDAFSITVWMNQGEQIAAFVVVSFYYTDLYDLDQTPLKNEWTLKLLTGFGIACLLIGGLSYLIPQFGFQNIYLFQMILLGLGLFSWRVGFIRMVEKAKAPVKVLIVGTRKIARLVAEELCRQKHLGMQVVGFIGKQNGEITLSYGNPVRVSLPVCPPQSTFEFIERERVSRILIEDQESCAYFPAQELVTLRLKGFPIEDCHTFFERLTSKIAISDLHPGWIVLSQGFNRSRWNLLIKRVIDILVSALGLIITSPITLLTAIAIKLDSPGPVFYRQERVGYSEHPFILYKFRSMVSEAEALSGPVWAQANDSRVTRVGKIIRKLRIDELPQMINVLKGEMSFVGPRPERPIFVSRLKEKIPYYHIRFSVKPGITGWAQILAPYGDSEEGAIDKLQYELYYLKNISPFLDLQIIFETLKVVILGKGAQ